MFALRDKSQLYSGLLENRVPKKVKQIIVIKSIKNGGIRANPAQHRAKPYCEGQKCTTKYSTKEQHIEISIL